MVDLQQLGVSKQKQTNSSNHQLPHQIDQVEQDKVDLDKDFVGNLVELVVDKLVVELVGKQDHWLEQLEELVLVGLQ